MIHRRVLPTWAVLLLMVSIADAGSPPQTSVGRLQSQNAAEVDRQDLSARRRESVRLDNYEQFGQWAEHEAYAKLTGEDRCTEIQGGEHIVGEFRAKGTLDDFHLVQVGRCSGDKMTIATYWGLYHGKEFIKGAVLQGRQFIGNVMAVTNPSGKKELLVLQGYEVGENSLTDHVIIFEWDSATFSVTDGSSRELISWPDKKAGEHFTFSKKDRRRPLRKISPAAALRLWEEISGYSSVVSSWMKCKENPKALYVNFQDSADGSFTASGKKQILLIGALQACQGSSYDSAFKRSRMSYFGIVENGKAVCFLALPQLEKLDVTHHRPNEIIHIRDVDGDGVDEAVLQRTTEWPNGTIEVRKGMYSFKNCKVRVLKYE